MIDWVTLGVSGETILTVGGLVVAAVIGAAFAGWQQPKVDADTKAQEAATAKTLSDLAFSLVEPLQQRNAALQAKVEDQKIEIDDLRTGVWELSGQITRLGHRPVWPPTP